MPASRQAGSRVLAALCLRPVLRFGSRTVSFSSRSEALSFLPEEKLFDVNILRLAKGEVDQPSERFVHNTDLADIVLVSLLNILLEVTFPRVQDRTELESSDW